MHHLDANKTAGEEARRQLLKNVASNIEQVLAATPHKTSTILSKLNEPDAQDAAGEVMYSDGPQQMAEQKQDDQLKHTYSSYVRIRDIALKTCRRRWTIGRSGKRGSGISVQAARYDDDDDDDIYIYIYIYIYIRGKIVLPHRIYSSLCKKMRSNIRIYSCETFIYVLSYYYLVLFFFKSYIYEVHTISFQTFFVWAFLLIVHTWNSSPFRSNLPRLQCICCTVPTTSGRPHGSPLVWACQWPSSQPLSSQLSHNDSLWALGITKSQREKGLDYREGDGLSWCPSWSNSLWQGWSWGLVYCSGGNATDPIWRVLAFFDGISSWTPFKPQHSNLKSNPNPLANQL